LLWKGSDAHRTSRGAPPGSCTTRADLRPDDHTAEWILHRSPEIAFRLVTREGASTDRSRVGIGVADLERERARLSTVWADVPTITTRPGVIAQLQIGDPDGNLVVLWQDLMHT
jgi:hypothetical protein